MGSWIASIILFAIGLFFWIITYIAAPLESRKRGRFVSGFAFLPFICFLLGGLLSPCKLLALLCLLDFNADAFPIIMLKQYFDEKRNK